MGTSLVPVAIVVNYADDRRLLETWYSEGNGDPLNCLRRGSLKATVNCKLLEKWFSEGNVDLRTDETIIIVPNLYSAINP